MKPAGKGDWGFPKINMVDDSGWAVFLCPLIPSCQLMHKIDKEMKKMWMPRLIAADDQDDHGDRSSSMKNTAEIKVAAKSVRDIVVEPRRGSLPPGITGICRRQVPARDSGEGRGGLGHQCYVKAEKKNLEKNGCCGPAVAGDGDQDAVEVCTPRCGWQGRDGKG